MVNVPTKVKLTPSEIRIRVGETAQLTPELFGVDNERCETTLPFRYETRNPQIVKIEPDGTVTGTAPGAAQIEAHYPFGGQTGPNPSTIYNRDAVIVVVSQ